MLRHQISMSQIRRVKEFCLIPYCKTSIHYGFLENYLSSTGLEITIVVSFVSKFFSKIVLKS